MELIFNKSKIERVPIKENKSETFVPGGILNSNYQKVAKKNIENAKSSSLYGIRRSVKSRLYTMTNTAETVVKLTIFLTLLGFLI